MKREDLIKLLVEEADNQGDEYFEIVGVIATLFPRKYVEQLHQLVNGPIWDGNIISKADRGVLFNMGLAIRVCCKGQQGHTGATYTALSVLQAINERAPKAAS